MLESLLSNSPYRLFRVALANLSNWLWHFIVEQHISTKKCTAQSNKVLRHWLNKNLDNQQTIIERSFHSTTTWRTIWSGGARLCNFGSELRKTTKLRENIIALQIYLSSLLKCFLESIVWRWIHNVGEWLKMRPYTGYEMEIMGRHEQNKEGRGKNQEKLMSCSACKQETD